MTKLFLGAILAAALVFGTATAASAGSSAVRAPVVKIKVKKFGLVLARRDHQALYTWRDEQQAGNKILCTGGCAQAWPPLLVRSAKAVPKHVRGIRGTFGVVRRPDRKLQVTLNGAAAVHVRERAEGRRPLQQRRELVRRARPVGPRRRDRPGGRGPNSPAASRRREQSERAEERGSGGNQGFPPKKFTEPVALSSTASAGFPAWPCGLPRTTLGGDFDLLALRARCTREATAFVRFRQDPSPAEVRKVRRIPRACPRYCYRVGTDGTGSSRETELLVPPSGVPSRSSRVRTKESNTTCSNLSVRTVRAARSRSATSV